MGAKKDAWVTRGSFIAKVVTVGNVGFNCVDEQGEDVRGVSANFNWPIGTWVTIVRTNDGLSIIGTAGSGPSSVYEP